MYEKNVKNRRICIKSLEKEKKKRKQKNTQMVYSFTGWPMFSFH